MLSHNIMFEDYLFSIENIEFNIVFIMTHSPDIYFGWVNQFYG